MGSHHHPLLFHPHRLPLLSQLPALFPWSSTLLLPPAAVQKVAEETADTGEKIPEAGTSTESCNDGAYLGNAFLDHSRFPSFPFSAPRPCCLPIWPARQQRHARHGGWRRSVGGKPNSSQHLAAGCLVAKARMQSLNWGISSSRHQIVLASSPCIFPAGTWRLRSLIGA